MSLDGRVKVGRLSGSGAAIGDTLVWDGARWVPGASGGDGTHVGAGSRSVQLGPNAIAPDTRTTALGDGAQIGAGATHSTAVGAGAIVRNSCPYSVAEGNSALVESDRGVAIGADAKVGTSSSYAVAVGVSSRALVLYATAVGALAEAGVASGAAGGTSIGYSAKAPGADGVAVGRGAQATGARSITLGAGFINSLPDRCVVMTNELELRRSGSGGGPATGNRLIMSDTATGTTYKCEVVNGTWTVTTL
jgi:hypothetical protein